MVFRFIVVVSMCLPLFRGGSVLMNITGISGVFSFTASVVLFLIFSVCIGSGVD